MHPEPAVAAQIWFAGGCAGLIISVDRDQHIKVLVGLGAQTFECGRNLILTAIEGHTKCDQRAAQRLMSCMMRSAQRSAK